MTISYHRHKTMIAGDGGRVVSAVLCYATSLLCEIAGIVLVMTEAGRARRVLASYERLAGPDGQPTIRQFEVGLDPLVKVAVGNQIKGWIGFALLLVGVASGSLGNFLSLAASSNGR
jgi:hypothetical protein